MLIGSPVHADDEGSAPGCCAMPAANIHPDRFRGCVPDLPAPLVERLLAVPRLRDKLSSIIAARHALDPCACRDLTAADRAPAAWPADQLIRLAHLAGGVWHARSLRQLIRGRSLAPVLSGFDQHLRAIAISHIDLAVADPAPSDRPGLADAIRHDGMHCLNAWIAGLPSCIVSRVVLKFAPTSAIGGPASATHQVRGVLIIRRLVGESPVSGQGLQTGVLAGRNQQALAAGTSP
jgi:hypothetical protein